MTDDPYTKREIDELKHDIIERLSRIEEQCLKTNGRVTALEKWMYLCIGGGATLSALVLPVVLEFLKRHL